ncbi:MAG: 5-(carboxyamino)imidazole ribonucleotide mutase [Desulfonatronovibrio sp.]
MEQSVKPQASIIMGSDSDLPVMKGAAEILDTFEVSYELTLVSAHRTPERLVSFCRNAHTRGVRVIIAGAGGAAHLPGMAAALSPVPVIGVPILSSQSIAGVDSLLSIVQMPRGVPVAAVAVNGAANAALLALQILWSGDEQGMQKILDYKDQLKEMVEQKYSRLEKTGYAEYMQKFLHKAQD